MVIGFEAAYGLEGLGFRVQGFVRVVHSLHFLTAQCSQSV